MNNRQDNSAIYLDNAASTPLRAEVKARMMELLETPFGNPSSTHQFGRKARAVIEEARKYIANSFGCTPAEIIFTSGGTEADNTALQIAVRDMGVRRIITSPLEHHAVLHTAQALVHHTGIHLDLVRVSEKGEVDLEHLEELLQEDQPTLVSLMHGNNEIGNLLDLETTGTLVKNYGALFHSDTVQTVGHFAIDLGQLSLDFMAASAHKFYGPKGIGFMYRKSSLKGKPLLYGGAQERGMRSGTENAMNIAAMHTALQYSLEHLAEESAYILDLKKYLKKSLQTLYTDIRFHGCSGDEERSLYTVLSAGFPSAVNDSILLFNLDLKGLAVSGGSACASGSAKTSHVLEALGHDTHPVLRFSFSKNNTREELDRAITILKEVMPPSV